MKWGPVAAMIVLLLLGAWAVYGPSLKHDVRPGALTGRFTLPGVKGELEMLPAVAGGEPTFRFLVAPTGSTAAAAPARVVSAAEFRAMFGDDALARVSDATGNVALRMLGVSGWGSVVWVAVGLAGQGLFFGRMMVQWVQSEKKRLSHVPESFWWFSLFGGAMLFTYFAWRQDIVGVLGQTSGVVIYARNLRLIRKERRRAERPAQGLAGVGGPQTAGGTASV
ncbi:MAG: lipid-A-disaccharide synthase N-terminal domain-containing protein [Phycisphaerales bacterium]